MKAPPPQPIPYEELETLFEPRLTQYHVFSSPATINPYAAHVYFNRANLFASLRKFKEAEEDYTRGD